MLGLRELRGAVGNLTATAALVAAAVIPGCSDDIGPRPIEASTPGELKPRPLGRDAEPVAKNVNQQAPRSIKEIQTKP